MCKSVKKLMCKNKPKHCKFRSILVTTIYIYKWIGIYTKQIKYFEFQSFIYQNLLFDYMFVMRKRCDIFQSTPYIHDTELRVWPVHGDRLCTNMIIQYGLQYESTLRCHNGCYTMVFGLFCMCASYKKFTKCVDLISSL